MKGVHLKDYRMGAPVTQVLGGNERPVQRVSAAPPPAALYKCKRRI